MQLTIGPILFYWHKEKVEAFYHSLSQLNLGSIYLGETVCAKRRELSLEDYITLARTISQTSNAQIVLSSLALLEANSELNSLKKLCSQTDFLIEANDMAAVHFCHEQQLPFIAGPALNIYNAYALAELINCGMQRWVAPVECSGLQIQQTLAQLDDLGIKRPEVEVFSYGHLPLAYSARCFTARAENRPKDQCKRCCIRYPEGIEVFSQEQQKLFALNGIQTLSGQVQNLISDVAAMRQAGITHARLSPRAEGFIETIKQWQAVLNGACAPLPTNDCNGYWHGKAGMFHLGDQHA
ncbi:U32 family peptidase [Pseudomonas sp. F1_0610]|uniref:U32 family peptidase n=1 Tax=Pseudomonas sp. F1_0610 TaxID=3114284 RepID=UPI0039C1AC23